jgi:hypothetical protein
MTQEFETKGEASFQAREDEHMCAVCEDVYKGLAERYGHELFYNRKMIAEEIHRLIGGTIVEGVLAR